MDLPLLCLLAFFEEDADFFEDAAVDDVVAVVVFFGSTVAAVVTGAFFKLVIFCFTILNRVIWNVAKFFCETIVDSFFL